jgi:hypothetical protein
MLLLKFEGRSASGAAGFRLNRARQVAGVSGRGAGCNAQSEAVRRISPMPHRFGGAAITGSRIHYGASLYIMAVE